MQRIISQEEWQALEEGILQLIELCETQKQANLLLRQENQALRDEQARLEGLLDEAEKRLTSLLEQLRTLEAER